MAQDWLHKLFENKLDRYYKGSVEVPKPKPPSFEEWVGTMLEKHGDMFEEKQNEVELFSEKEFEKICPRIKQL